MSNKSITRKLIVRCFDVTQGELDLLDTWIRDPGTTSGRQAQCRSAKRFISDTETAPQVIINRILERLDALADGDVVAVPKPEEEDVVAHVEGDLQDRQGWPGPNLEQPWFEIAIARAQDNAQHAADCAAAILQECT